MANTSSKKVNLKSFSISIDDIKSIWLELNEMVREQGEIELAKLVRAEGQSDDEFTAYKEKARSDVFKILATIVWEDGSADHTIDPELLRSDRMLIREVYLSNITPYKRETNGIKPEHNFELLFDFKFPPLLDASTPASDPTANSSILNVEGSRGSWKAGVEDIVKKYIRHRYPLRNWFHGHFIYDLFLVLVGIPMALYGCWLASGTITNFLGFNTVVAAAGYLYAGFVMLWLYRLLFSYTRWAFPKVELRDQSTRPRKHRRILWGILITFAGKILWETLGPHLNASSWV